MSVQEYASTIAFKNGKHDEDAAMDAIAKVQPHLSPYLINFEQAEIGKSFTPTFYADKDASECRNFEEDPYVEAEINKRQMYAIRNRLRRILVKTNTPLLANNRANMYKMTSLGISVIDSGIPGMDPVERIAIVINIYRVDAALYTETCDIWKQVEAKALFDQARCQKIINGLADKNMGPMFGIDCIYLNRQSVRGNDYTIYPKHEEGGLISKDHIIREFNKLGIPLDWLDVTLPENIDE